MDRWNDELYHHGVLGMRWGVRNAETKARYAARGISKTAKKVTSNISSAVKKRSGVGSGRKYETKDDLINKGSAKDIYKNRRSLTVNEMSTARNRLNVERDLQNLNEADFRYGSRYLNRSKAILGTSAAILGSYVAIKKFGPDILDVVSKIKSGKDDPFKRYQNLIKKI